MTLKEIRRRGFARMDKCRDNIRCLECRLLEDMDEGQREHIRECIRQQRAYINGMTLLLADLGVTDWTRRGIDNHEDRKN